MSKYSSFIFVSSAAVFGLVLILQRPGTLPLTPQSEVTQVGKKHKLQTNFKCFGKLRERQTLHEVNLTLPLRHQKAAFTNY